MRGHRRRVLKLLGGLGAWLAGPRIAAAAPYRVGVGASPDPYEATRRAIEASAQWPGAAISGRTVIVKPNLVGGRPAESGTTTDPEVVRALVDLSLRSGAARVLIVEGGHPTAPFSPCGYGFFGTYDPGGRVALVDLAREPLTLAPVPGGGLAYRRIYLPSVVLDPSAIFVSAGKLKTHTEVAATLASKNLFGIPPPRVYFLADAPQYAPRYHLHDRGASQVIVDLLATRRVDFAVVDGVWGMEGSGPTLGDPVRVDLVVAGRNAVAVDRVCLDVMGTPQDRPQYLAYAGLLGLGPSSLSQVEIAGDPYAPRGFVQPRVPPVLWYPKATPGVFAPGVGEEATIAFKTGTPAETRLDVLRVSETSPLFTVVRTLRAWSAGPAGLVASAWDGRDDGGDLVAPDFYLVRAQARHAAGDEVVAASSGGVLVSARSRS
jgi:uncharacterized protein (DUF362 family)